MDGTSVLQGDSPSLGFAARRRRPFATRTRVCPAARDCSERSHVDGERRHHPFVGPAAKSTPAHAEYKRRVSSGRRTNVMWCANVERCCLCLITSSPAASLPPGREPPGHPPVQDAATDSFWANRVDSGFSEASAGDSDWFAAHQFAQSVPDLTDATMAPDPYLSWYLNT